MNKKEKKGMYFLATTLVALAILVGGATAYKASMDKQEEKLQAQKEIARQAAIAQEKQSKEVETVKEEVKPIALATEEQKETKPVAQESQEETIDMSNRVIAVSGQTSQVALETMEIPLIGALINDYSPDQLIYSATLDQWMTHDGIDIRADLGSTVATAMDGTITAVTNDSTWGCTITIDHGAGIKTTYSNLQNIDGVTVGAKVKKGDTIGAVGQTALYEIADPPHLHFTLSIDGKPIDSKQYIPKQAFANK